MSMQKPLLLDHFPLSCMLCLSLFHICQQEVRIGVCYILSMQEYNILFNINNSGFFLSW